MWPTSAAPLSTRLGYTVSEGIYLPASAANGLAVSVISGTALVLAGRPADPDHRLLASLPPGGSYDILGLASDEVLSVQSESPFTVALRLSTKTAPGPSSVFAGQTAWWRCNTPGCTDPDWPGTVITWPSWSAYETNARSGSNSRTVYSADGTLLYPYMGLWAHGCTVTVVSGQALIIEWQRGTDMWRETLLNPGQSHTINLVGADDGAMIEAPDNVTAFEVSLGSCTPQPVPK